MSANTNGVDSDCEENKPQKRQVKHDSGAADLEKVTDYMEDSELSSQNIAQVCPPFSILFFSGVSHCLLSMSRL